MGKTIVAAFTAAIHARQLVRLVYVSFESPDRVTADFAERSSWRFAGLPLWRLPGEDRFLVD